MGYCSNTAPGESYKLTCTSDLGAVTVGIHYFGTDNCSGTETAYDEVTDMSESCVSDGVTNVKYLCSTDTQPWGAYDTSKDGYWRQRLVC